MALCRLKHLIVISEYVSFFPENVLKPWDLSNVLIEGSASPRFKGFKKRRKKKCFVCLGIKHLATSNPHNFTILYREKKSVRSEIKKEFT